MKLHLKALRYGSHRVAPANYTIPASTLRTFARWRHLNGTHLIQVYQVTMQIHTVEIVRKKFGVRLQEHRTEVVAKKTKRTFTKSQRVCSLSEHNKSALFDHAAQENHNDQLVRR